MPSDKEATLTVKIGNVDPSRPFTPKTTPPQPPASTSPTMATGDTMLPAAQPGRPRAPSASEIAREAQSLREAELVRRIYATGAGHQRVTPLTPTRFAEGGSIGSAVPSAPSLARAIRREMPTTPSPVSPSQLVRERPTIDENTVLGGNTPGIRNAATVLPGAQGNNQPTNLHAWPYDWREALREQEGMLGDIAAPWQLPDYEQRREAMGLLAEHEGFHDLDKMREWYADPNAMSASQMAAYDAETNRIILEKDRRDAARSRSGLFGQAQAGLFDSRYRARHFDEGGAVGSEAATHSPAFKGWFGDWTGGQQQGGFMARLWKWLRGGPASASVVRDEQGRPKPVYHGTKAKFDTYDPEKANPDGLFGRGYYHTESAQMGANYAHGNIFGDRPETGEENVQQNFLNIRQPYDADRGFFSRLIHNRGLARFMNYDMMEDVFGGKEGANAYLRSLGHDAVTHVGGRIIRGSPEHRVWIPFDPTQAKSTSNQTFDPNNPNRFMAEGGEIHGPGTSKSDDVPAVGPGNQPIRLSNKEYILPDEMVKAFGGPAELDRIRKSVLGKSPAAAPGFADGGQPGKDMDLPTPRTPAEWHELRAAGYLRDSELRQPGAGRVTPTQPPGTSDPFRAKMQAEGGNTLFDVGHAPQDVATGKATGKPARDDADIFRRKMAWEQQRLAEIEAENAEKARQQAANPPPPKKPPTQTTAPAPDDFDPAKLRSDLNDWLKDLTDSFKQPQRDKLKESLAEWEKENDRWNKAGLDAEKAKGQRQQKYQDEWAKTQEQAMRDVKEGKTPRAVPVPKVEPTDPIQRRAFDETERDRKARDTQRRADIEERQVFAARMRTDPEFRKRGATPEEHRARDQMDSESQRRDEVRAQHEARMKVDPQYRQQVGRNQMGDTIAGFADIANALSGGGILGKVGYYGHQLANMVRGGGGAGGGTGAGAIAAANGLPGVGATGATGGIGGAGAGGGLGASLSAAAGPLGLVVEAAMMVKKAFIEVVDSAGKTGAAILRVDADGLAQGFTDIVRKAPLVGDAFGAIGDAALGMFKAADSMAARFGQYNPQIAMASARAEINQIRADIRRANELAPNMAEYIDKRQEQKQKFEDIATKLADALLPALTGVLEATLTGVTIAENSYTMLEAIANAMTQFATGNITGAWNTIADALSRIAHNTRPASENTDNWLSVIDVPMMMSPSSTAPATSAPVPAGAGPTLP